jgi:hypothetical protein
VWCTSLTFFLTDESIQTRVFVVVVFVVEFPDEALWYNIAESVFFFFSLLLPLTAHSTESKKFLAAAYGRRNVEQYK